MNFHGFQYTKHATPPTVCIHNFTVFSFEVLHGPQTVNYEFSGESLRLLTLTSGWKRWQETPWGSARPQSSHLT